MIMNRMNNEEFSEEGIQCFYYSYLSLLQKNQGNRDWRVNKKKRRTRGRGEREREKKKEGMIQSGKY